MSDQPSGPPPDKDEGTGPDTILWRLNDSDRALLREARERCGGVRSNPDLLRFALAALIRQTKEATP